VEQPGDTAPSPQARGRRSAPPPGWAARVRKVLYWAAAAVVFAFYLAVCLHRVAGPWMTGPDGRDGAFLAIEARNTLRAGPQDGDVFLTGFTPQSYEIASKRQPMLLHVHLVILQALFGDSEAVSRIVPAAYSVLVLVLIFLAGYRLWNPETALLAAAFFALTPVNAILANMVDHEQGGIFWCLALTVGYVRWAQSGRRILFVLTLVTATMAVQFDWPGYYVAAMLAVHAVIMGLRQRTSPPRWKPEYTWAVSFTAVVLVNLAGFVVWRVALRSSLEGTLASVSLPTSVTPDYMRQVLERSLDLHGVVLLALLGAWIVLFVGRLATSRARRRDLIPLSFLLAQAVQLLAFRKSGPVRSDLVYYLSVTIALGGADAVQTAARWLGRVVASRTDSFVSRSRLLARLPLSTNLVVAALLLKPLIGYQAILMWENLVGGEGGGHGSFVRPYHDGYEEAMLAKALRRRCEREDLYWILHSSIRHRTSAFLYYLDAPVTLRDAVTVQSADRDLARHVYLVADLHNLTGDEDLGRLRALSETHPTEVWQRRFVTVDVARESRGREGKGWILAQGPSTWLWEWLVNPLHAPTAWVPDPGRNVVARLLEPNSDLSAEQMVGGSGGRLTRWRCPRGEVLSSVRASTRDAGEAAVASLRPVCFVVGEAPYGGVPSLPTEGPFTGAWPPIEEQLIGCGPGDGVTGIFGSGGDHLHAIGLVCTQVLQGVGPDGTAVASLGTSYRTAAVGSLSKGVRFDVGCPPGRLVTSYSGRWGSEVIAAGIACSPVEAVVRSGPSVW